MHCSACPSQGKKVIPSPNNSILTTGEILQDNKQVPDIQGVRVSRVIYHTQHTCLKSEQLFSSSFLDSPVASQAHLGTS